MRATAHHSIAHVVARVVTSLLGGWVFVWGFVTLGIASMLAIGRPYEDAQTLMYLLAFVVFLVVFCWSFAAASLGRVGLVLFGGGGAMTGIAWLLLRTNA